MPSARSDAEGRREAAREAGARRSRDAEEGHQAIFEFKYREPEEAKVKQLTLFPLRAE